MYACENGVQTGRRAGTGAEVGPDEWKQCDLCEVLRHKSVTAGAEARANVVRGKCVRFKVLRRKSLYTHDHNCAGETTSTRL